jgi:chromosome segregation ATPase
MISKYYKLNITHMKTIMNYRILVMLSFFLLIPVLTQAQTDKKATELKNLETGIATAKAKVAMNERKLAIADSVITTGTQMIAESKTEIKAVDAESKKLDKDLAANKKPLTKLSTSKDKGESIKAKADLKALDVQYRSDAKALDTRLRAAEKKQTTGNANLTKGKAAKKSAQDALKISRAALNAAQAKYDAASASGDNTNSKDKKKK